ncbi:hypothetical protein C2I18_05405 [Paenibacillus sp. PK3_47]|uniref:hypothetical protein n=1 Tax=Paenibacillus sp. PK3_47 TaxID=2072642 RepID=UPI00201D88E6|nr:hypothetical protein [Paenibacillus sp. PK3_47]UQZ33051.1 hypothetical protein C2I18_05405 [Paenibacillus sp. PK3_47]
MKRCIYRSEGLEGEDTTAFFQSREVSSSLIEVMKRAQVDHLSLFGCGSQLFLYYECLGTPVPPEDLLPEASKRLAGWPGGNRGRRWAALTDIFHYQRPVSAQHWERSSTESRPYGRLALLKPEETASYIYYHYQYQEERPGDGDKYGVIGLHENVLFFYAEQPDTREPAPYAGKLKTSLRPDNWAEVMEPHFIKWEGAPAGQELWRKLTPVLEVRSFAGKLGTRDA